MIRVGWDGPMDKSVEVDFVGHSWFFKKEWLQDLLNAPKEVQLRTAGEDMAFSYQLLKDKNIKTYVPPHPKNNFELYGSLPETAVKLGHSPEAISMDPKHLRIMNNVVNFLKKNGWDTLSVRNPYLFLTLAFYPFKVICVRFICLFIPVSKWRKKIRRKLI